MIRKLLLTALTLVVITACETTRQTTNSNIGVATSQVKPAGFDRKKAAQVRLNAGLQYLKLGNLKAAKRHLDKALAFGADSANVHFGLAYYYQNVKDYERAEKAYRKALKIEPDNPDILNGYGQYLCERGDFRRALDYFERAIETPIYPDVTSALNNAGVCSLRAGNPKQADHFFRKALNIDPKMPVPLLEMAKLEFAKKRYQRAMSYLRRYEAVAKPTPESLWLGLRTAFYLKDKDARASYALKLEKMFPDSDETAEYLDNKQRWM